MRRSRHGGPIARRQPDLPARTPAQQRQRRRRRPAHPDRVAPDPACRVRRRARGRLRPVGVARVDAQRDHARERRIVRLLARRQLAAREAGIVVRLHRDDRCMIGCVRLDDHPARPLAAPRAARHLLQQLEGPLPGAKVRQVHGLIGRQHADQRDPGKVVALGHHLRPDQHVDLAGVHAGEQRVQAGGGVAIEPRDARVGKALAHHRLQPFRAGAQPFDARLLARRAAVRDGRDAAAVVAHEARAPLVIRHRHRAAGATDDVPTRAAQRDGREPAPVEEQDALLARRQRRAQRLRQRR